MHARRAARACQKLPHRPITHLPKISTTKILTKSAAFWASERAALLPTMPTHILQVEVNRQPFAHRAFWQYIPPPGALAPSDLRQLFLSNKPHGRNVPYTTMLPCMGVHARFSRHSPTNKVGKATSQARPKNGVT